MAKLSKWEQSAEALRGVLPKPLCTRRCELLPQVLEEWERSALGEHLSREPRADFRKRIKKRDTVTKLARHLHESLDNLEQEDRYAIVLQMIRAERSTEEVSRKKLEYLSEYLARVGDVQTTEIWKPGPGQPRNVTAYFVLQDAAAIFEWLTGVQATREVDRDTGAEIGPFSSSVQFSGPSFFKKVPLDCHRQ
jgi:hypothetical protein